MAIESKWGKRLTRWGAFAGSVMALVTFIEVALPMVKSSYNITSDLLTSPENQRLIQAHVEGLEQEFRDTIDAIKQRQNILIQDMQARQGSEHFAVGFRGSKSGERFIRWWDGVEYRCYIYEDSLLYFYNHQGQMIIPFVPHDSH